VQFLQRGQLLTAQPGAPTNAALGTRVMGLGRWGGQRAACWVSTWPASQDMGHGEDWGRTGLFLFSLSLFVFFLFFYFLLSNLFTLLSHILNRYTPK
jgi:hypothetical protein